MSSSEKTNNLKIGDIVTFGEPHEKLPFRIKAEHKNLRLAVRKLDREKDIPLMQVEINNGAYSGLNEAYKYMRMQPVYTIINLLENQRGKHNEKVTFLDLNYTSDCIEMLKRINRGSLEMDKKSIVNLNIVKIESE